MTPPEPFTYTLAPRAQRDLAELPAGAAHACAVFIADRLTRNPKRLGGRLHGRWAGHLSAHVGGYRVVYRVDDRRHHVRVAHIGPRGSVYNA